MPIEPQVNILLVDDHPENLLALEAILGGLEVNLVRANSGEEALRALLHQDFAVILLDVQMPTMDGFETATLIRSRDRSRQTPIIFLTAFSTSEQFMFMGYSLGAVDYLNKPIEPIILTSKVTVFVDLFKKTEAVKQQAAQLATINTELKQSEERFRLLCACSPVGIFVTDTEGRFIYTNPCCQEICHFSAEESLGEGWLPVIHPDDREWVLPNWLAYLNQRQEYSDEFRLQRSDGSERWVHVRSSPMLSDKGAPLGHVGTIENITQRKQAEVTHNLIVQEQAARQEAEAANRMKDEFLAVLSHELRTPLNSILGWSRLLRAKKFDSDTTTRALESIERNALAQSQLIEDILDVSLIIQGKMRLSCGLLNLITVVEGAIESVRPLMEAKKIQLEIKLDREAGYVWGDPVRLQQVVWNLLTNAIKFTPEAGCVEVRLEREGGGGYAQITVTDTGIGVSPEFLPKVFDRFRQADSTTTRSHSGLGLGLAIVRHLVELHQGTIRAESLGEGTGATFTVQIPLRTAAENLPKRAQPLPDVHTQLMLQGVRILIIDDESDGREFLGFVLQQHGAITTSVESADAAIAILDSFQPTVLISDIGMPEKDGYMLIRQLRDLEAKQGNHIPAIALTAYSRQEDRQQALDGGFELHMAKPFEINTLVEAIGQLLKTSSTYH